VVNFYDQRTGRQTKRNLTTLQDFNTRLQAEIEFLNQLPDALSQHILPCLDEGKITFQGVELVAMILPLMQDELSNYCANLSFDPKSFTPEQFFKWLAQLSQALAYIHQNDSIETPHVHRDLKPSNVLLDQTGNAFLTDFGILKAAQHTGTTSIAFSKDCCAPEQRLPLYLEQTNAQAKVKRQYLITPKLDIYALGMLIHNLLVGSTKAQDDLAEESTVDLHIKTLPTLANAPSTIQPIGELGKLGGLLVSEQTALRHKLKQWLPPLFSRMGIMIGSPASGEFSLPNYPWLAERITQFINQMLKPWPENRPTAIEVKQEIEFWHAYYNLELREFTLTGEPQYQNTQALNFYLIYAGNIGLTQSSLIEWLKFSLDNQTIHPHITQHTQSPDKPSLAIQLTSPIAAGKHHLQAFIYIQGVEYAASWSFENSLSAEQLWQQHEHTAALQQELRQEWLEALLATCQDTKTRFDFMQLMQQLKTWHPQATTLLDNFYERANQAKPEPVDRSKKNSLLTPPNTTKPKFTFKTYRPLITVFVVLLLGFSLWQFYKKPPADPAKINNAALLRQLQANLASDNTYEQLALLAAEPNNVNAQQWLGYRYLVGNGVKVDLNMAKHWYQKAANAGSASAKTQLAEIDKALATKQAP
jgi:serine/threonine protein kinase